jgi:glutamate synthase (NADPH/NADH) large chain
VSSHIVQRFGMRNGLQPDHLTIKLAGSAGQSLGAFGAPGLKIEVMGEANDYVGKGLSGAIVVVRPPLGSPLAAEENAIIGNTVLYGATAGALFANGRAGERFCVRNSGAEVVVEGCGSNGCEYMTGGVAVILGRFGDNFGAGMTGGMAYLYDPDGEVGLRLNGETVIAVPIESEAWEAQLRGLIERHARETGSRRAGEILRHWEEELPRFRQIVPKEMLTRLAHPLSERPEAIRA